MNLGDEHMTDETRDIYRAKVAERQAAEDALVQKRIEAASDYVGTRAEANRCVKERVATFDVHTQVGTFKAERETKLRDVTMPKNREGEHAFLEALETAAESDATWARVLSLVDTEPDSWGGADLARLRAVLIKKKAEETQALAAEGRKRGWRLGGVAGRGTVGRPSEAARGGLRGADAVGLGRGRYVRAR